jgi:hypothetical protein
MIWTTYFFVITTEIKEDNLSFQDDFLSADRDWAARPIRDRTETAEPLL